MIIKRRQKKE